MAFLLSKDSEIVKVIARCDDSLICDDVEAFEKAYESYLEDLDESKLQFSEGCEPTRFLLKRNLNLKEHIKIKNDQVKVTNKGEFLLQQGSYQVEEVRMSLVGIENPPNVIGCLEYKADGAGGASKDLLEKLVMAGIVDDLHSVLTNIKKNKKLNKKN